MTICGSRSSIPNGSVCSNVLRSFQFCCGRNVVLGQPENSQEKQLQESIGVFMALRRPSAPWIVGLYARDTGWCRGSQPTGLYRLASPSRGMRLSRSRCFILSLVALSHVGQSTRTFFEFHEIQPSCGDWFVLKCRLANDFVAGFPGPGPSVVLDAIFPKNLVRHAYLGRRPDYLNVQFRQSVFRNETVNRPVLFKVSHFPNECRQELTFVLRPLSRLRFTVSHRFSHDRIHFPFSIKRPFWSLSITVFRSSGGATTFT